MPNVGNASKVSSLIALLLLALLAPGVVLAKQKPKAKPVKRAKAQKIITTPSGLQYVDYSIGFGPLPRLGETVLVNYTGRFVDSTVFDSNVDTSFGHVIPLPFRIGMGQVIKGWDEGISSMRIGGKRKLIIPYALAYGEKGYAPKIPAKATLVFDVELLGIRAEE